MVVSTSIRFPWSVAVDTTTPAVVLAAMWLGHSGQCFGVAELVVAKAEALGALDASIEPQVCGDPRRPSKRRRPFRTMVVEERPTMDKTIEDECFPTLSSGVVSQREERWRVMPGLHCSTSFRTWV